MTRDFASDATIGEALARLETVDCLAATDARSALDWLVGEGGLESLSRYGLQQFCWYELPFKWIVEPGVRREIIAGLGRFFDLAGLANYAELCRSESTANVLAQWELSPTAGFGAYRRACAASGVEPPDLPDFVWSMAMGEEEFTAFWSTAMALEIAIDAGMFIPGAKAWRVEQLGVAREHLIQPRAELLGSSYMESIWTARLSGWIDGPIGMPSRARAQLLAPVGNALLHPIDTPREAARSVRSLLWLLDAVDNDGSGLALTARGNLPRAVVRSAVLMFPSWSPTPISTTAPLNEHDVASLVCLHELSLDMKLIRRSRGRLFRTRRGDRMRGDPKSLWRAVAEHQVIGMRFEAAIAELAFADLIVESLLPVADLVAESTVVLTESGWHAGRTGAPVPRDAVVDAVERFALLATTLGWVRERRARSERRALRLTETGRSTGLTALRAAAMTPRRLP